MEPEVYYDIDSDGKQHFKVEGKKYNDPSIKHRDTKTWKRLKHKLPLVTSLARDGLTNAQIAEYLGISVFTLVTYRQRYPEFDECFKIGRAEAAELVAGKMFSLAMGIADIDHTQTTIEQTITYEEDPETGEVYEVVKERKKVKRFQDKGRVKPDAGAGQFILKAYAPEIYNASPSDATPIEPVQFVDDLAESSPDDTKLLYDDSQDAQGDD